MKVNRRFFLVLLLLAALFTLWLIYQDDLFLRLVFLFSLLLLISYISARFSLHELIVHRSSRFKKMSVGHYFEDHFDIENKHLFWKQWIEIHDHSGISGNPEEVRVLSGIDARKIRTFNTYTFLRKRGVYSLGPLQIKSSGFLGFFETEMWVDSPERIVVLPRIIDLDHFAHLPAYLSGGKELKVASTETTPFAAGVREYYPGDPLRRIHWPTTARKNTLMVKEFDKDPQMNTWIVVDSEEESHFELFTENGSTHPSDFWSVRQQTKYSLPRSTFEYGITIAASLAKYFIENKYGVGLISSGKQDQQLATDHGYRQLGKILDILSYIQPSGETPFPIILTEYMKQLNRGSTLILITPRSCAEMAGSIDMAIARGLKPIFVQLDRSSFNPMEIGDANLEQSNLTEMTIRGVPCFQIKYESDLKECLENGAIHQKQGIHS